VPPTPSSHRSDADFSAHSLRGYQDRLSDSFVLKDLHTYARVPRFLDRHRLCSTYPEFLTQLFHGCFSNDGTPRHHLVTMARRAMRESGLTMLSAASDAAAAARSL
jgi:electron transfer flavoprotein-quinone oxidoreductase